LEDELRGIFRDARVLAGRIQPNKQRLFFEEDKHN
jgi:hypothetical protein